MKSEHPLVSVILCTRDRPDSFLRALASVLAQDAGDFEVVVVDGSDPPVELGEGTPVRLIGGERCGEGRARAAGLRAARGDLIAWCDDDDEWRPEHLSALLDALDAHPRTSLAYATGTAAAPSRRNVVEGAPVQFRIRAGDVLHRADAARAAGGFDFELHWGAAGDLWVRIAERGEIIARSGELTQHHAVPSAIGAAERKAALARLREVWEDTARRAGAARERLKRRGRAPVRFDPRTWNDTRRQMIVQTSMKGPGSFPVVSMALMRELLQRGVQITLGPWREGRLLPEWDAIVAPLGRHDRLGLIYDFRTGAAHLRAERVAYYHMWETTVIPAWQVEEINGGALLLYTPCRESARIARANGVNTAVKVLQHGVDREAFPYLERVRTGDEPYTFGSNGVFTARKGIDVLMRAFREEFAPHEPVRLLLKHTYTTYTGEIPDDPRITLTVDYLDHDGLLDFLRRLDAYVLPSRGEGFGLTGLEAMATGLPLIATNWSGPVEYLDAADTYPLDYRLEETGGVRFQNRRQFGLWAEPDIHHLRRLMRHLYEHREEGVEAGRRASARVQRDWTWGRVAEQLIADFDLLARGLTPPE